MEKGGRRKLPAGREYQEVLGRERFHKNSTGKKEISRKWLTEDEIGESRRELQEKERWKRRRKERNRGKVWSRKREGARLTAIRNERDAVIERKKAGEQNNEIEVEI